MKRPENQLAILKILERRTEPFRYVMSVPVFNREYAKVLFDSINDGISWRLHQSSFYKFWESDLNAVGRPGKPRPFSHPDALALLRRSMERAFSVRLSADITLTAHKLSRGHYVGIHNDAISEDGETHRLVVNLSRNFSDRDGGFLVFFNSNKVADIHRAFRPRFNTGIGFELTVNSYHAVTEVRRGSRLSIVYSFRPESS